MPEKKENLETENAEGEEQKEVKSKSNEIPSTPAFNNIRLT